MIEMGKIIGKKTMANGDVKLKVLLDQKEMKALNGHFKEVYMFSPDLCKENTDVIEAGLKGSIKYFKVPRRFILKKQNIGDISCQEIETKDEYIFIYSMPKVK